MSRTFHFCLFICILFLLSCSKDATNINPEKSYPGAIDSILTYTANVGYDSGFSSSIVAPNIVRFEYDGQRRLSKLNHFWFGQNNFYTFSYNGDNQRPLQIRDSMPTNNPSTNLPEDGYGTIQTEEFTYDAQVRVTEDIQRERNLPKSYEYIKNYRRTFVYGANYFRTLDSASMSFGSPQRDSTALDALNQPTFEYRGGNSNRLNYTYYNETNPFYQLAAARVMYRFNPYWTYFGHIQFNFFSTPQLPKTIEEIYYLASRPIRTSIQFYYEKDATGRIEKVVIARRSYNEYIPTQIEDYSFCNMRIFYHP